MPQVRRKEKKAAPAESPSELHELREVLKALRAMRDGDFSVRLPSDWTGLTGKIADTFNEIVFSNQRVAEELDRIGQVVGKEGKTRQRAAWGGAAVRGVRWKVRSTT